MKRAIALGLCALIPIGCKKDQAQPIVVDPAAAHIAKLKDGSEAERIAAAQALAGMGEKAKSAVPALERAVEDSDEKVRQQAALAMQAIAPENAAGRSGMTLLRLKQIGKAMHDHVDANNGSLPPTCTVVTAKDGKQPSWPGLSWRVLLLPHLDQKELFGQFKLDEPWDSENNRKLIDKMPSVYAPPVGCAVETKPGETHFQVFTYAAPFGYGAQATPFAHPALIALQKHPPCRITDITDGTAHTFLVVEAAKPVIWTKPEDVVVSDAPLPELGHAVDDLFHVCMADGAVMSYSRRGGALYLRIAIGRADGIAIVHDAMLPDRAPPPPKATTPVLGRVTMKGVPLATGWVVLHDNDGREYGGQLAVDGSFLIKGAPIGPVKVTIAMGDPFAAWLANPDMKFKFPPRLPVPDKYLHKDSTSLQLDVKPDTKEINLAIE